MSDQESAHSKGNQTDKKAAMCSAERTAANRVNFVFHFSTIRLKFFAAFKFGLQKLQNEMWLRQRNTTQASRNAGCTEADVVLIGMFALAAMSCDCPAVEISIWNP